MEGNLIIFQKFESDHVKTLLCWLDITGAKLLNMNMMFSRQPVLSTLNNGEIIETDEIGLVTPTPDYHGFGAKISKLQCAGSGDMIVLYRIVDVTFILKNAVAGNRSTLSIVHWLYLMGKPVYIMW